LRTIGSVTTSGAGVINTAFSNLPSGSAEWASCVALFDSYRVEKMILEFIPIRNSYTAAGILGGPLYTAFDPDSISNPGSTLALLGKANLRVMDAFKHWSYAVDRMPRISSASAFAGSYTIWGDGYIDTADAVGTSAIQVYSDNNVASTQLGTYVQTWIVHFVSRT